jgi:tyrosyl-tRNA synthetase
LLDAAGGFVRIRCAGGLSLGEAVCARLAFPVRAHGHGHAALDQVFPGFDNIKRNSDHTGPVCFARGLFLDYDLTGRNSFIPARHSQGESLDMESVIHELEARRMIAQITDPALADRLRSEKAVIYIGFDPTADSLHVGHMMPIIALSHFQKYGHGVLCLVGGATAMVGDPSGKSEERNLLTLDQVAQNARAVKAQLERFLSFEGENPARMIDNNDWISGMSFIDWLRDVGKHFTINYMISKESVKKRLASEQGISFTEFSYMTMQAFDFLHLYDEHQCTIQGGGNDQWGNITAGMDLIHKVRGSQAYGITFPLLTTASGEKFGKSEGNPVWLDPERTSPYQFYQFWFNQPDEDAKRFLYIFTFLNVEEIAAICAAHDEKPHERAAQKTLAAELTRTVHGAGGLEKALRASNALFGGALSGLGKTDLEDIFKDVPSSEVPRSRVQAGMPLVDLLTETGLCKSRGEARRFIDQGGVYLNNERAGDADRVAGAADLLADSIMVLRHGKKKYHLVRVAGQ